jgi:hypothetical protein
VVGLRPEQFQAEQPGDKQPELFDIHVLEFGLDSAQVAVELSGIFGIEPDAARQIAEGVPLVIKRATSPEEADRILDALKPLGAVTVLMPSREAIEQAMTQLELRGQAPAAPFAPGALATPCWAEAAPTPLGRVALRAGLEAEPAWNSAPEPGSELLVPASQLEGDPFDDPSISTLATLSLPRAPPPLLTRQKSDDIEAPAPLIDRSERAESGPIPRVSQTQPIGTTSYAEPQELELASEPGLEWELESGAALEADHGALELDVDPTLAVAALHGEMVLEDHSGGGLDLDVDPDSVGNAHVPLHLGTTLSSAPPAPGAASRPVAPPAVAQARASQPMPGGPLPLLGDLPPLPDLPPLLGELPPLPGLGARPMPPPPPPPASGGSAWLTGAAELPGLPAPGSAAQARGPRPPAVPGTKVSAQDLRRELANNRFAMGEAFEAPLPGSGAAQRDGAGGLPFAGGLELDGPVRKKSRREPGGEPRLPEPSAVRVHAPPAPERPRPAGVSDAQPVVAKDAPVRKASAAKRGGGAARVARESAPIAPALPLLIGMALIGVALYLDKSVLYGNAYGPWFLLDAAGLFGLALALLGMLRSARGAWTALLLSVAAAYAVNVYAKPLVGNEMQPEEASTRTGEVVLGEGAGKKEFPVSNAHLLAADAQGLIRAYRVRELALHGVAVGGGEPDLVIYLEMQEPGGEDLTAVSPDIKRFVGKELRVRAENTLQDDTSRAALSGAARPEHVVGGWAVMTEVLPFEGASSGRPSWRVKGHLELDLQSDDGTRSQVRGTFNLRAFWDTP